ncbi:hypothetical protein [Synechococcus sp. BMK-MC-1]|uniref:hypothetical protein n=1 Tax=Synechococcus sp. BMK-MC-1 TaxID=1442551 RepID=UPI00185FF0D2|nr:hypothetical protein [Synechococcus sp. BMK-MC-1]QNI67176.1 hypothetical protein SynBMKMC1_01093 [Synechococcus sp. BMK-MC-1]
MAEVAEKLRSQESQTQFLEQARTDLLTQFRSLSGQSWMAPAKPCSRAPRKR